MKNFKSHFKFNKQERSGIFFLLLIIVLLQSAYYVFISFAVDDTPDPLTEDTRTQAQIDALKEEAGERDSIKIFPFNPNFITDYKGYVLGMSVTEIDRLHAFRARNKYVNSPGEFQKVTSVSDSLLEAISPYFKFPEWTKNSGRHAVDRGQYPNNSQSSISDTRQDRGTGGIKDLNSATAAELRSVKGVGGTLSDRIVKFRDRLGGFLVDGQLYDVYGLEADVAKRVLERFQVRRVPKINKINLNTAPVAEMVKLVYIRYSVAQDIVTYREKNGRITSFDELKQIQDFPADKIDRIALYLSL